ncbi:hypothetical protein GGX14DRAFT_566493 [Mycena pura]|uniref:Uncharacterized protein n=1 Tax=Mycena pura TaxID=153505 RepID=A0AAD6VEV8_9AGAR|nr:hypothetical protein GGX14DRAFT_566493 [Mycena pura]
MAALVEELEIVLRTEEADDDEDELFPAERYVPWTMAGTATMLPLVLPLLLSPLPVEHIHLWYMRETSQFPYIKYLSPFNSILVAITKFFTANCDSIFRLVFLLFGLFPEDIRIESVIIKGLARDFPLWILPLDPGSILVIPASLQCVEIKAFRRPLYDHSSFSEWSSTRRRYQKLHFMTAGNKKHLSLAFDNYSTYAQHDEDFTRGAHYLRIHLMPSAICIAVTMRGDGTQDGKIGITRSIFGIAISGTERF